MRLPGTRNARGGVMLIVMSLLVVVAIIAAALIALSGDALRRANRGVSALTAEACVQSAVEYGRQYYGERYASWDAMLSGAAPGFNNPGTPQAQWGAGSFGRADGQPVTADAPAQFRVTIEDNVDEVPPATPNPSRDNDLQILLRAECVAPELAIPTNVAATESAPAPDPNGWRGTVPQDTDLTRTRRVVEVVLTHIPQDTYAGQRGGGTDGSRNVSN